MSEDSIRLELTFPAGQFHATPWGHHVNEGLPEWPPSPWRVLRALVAALETRAAHVDRAIAVAAIEKLVAAPSFTLPEASVGHIRHYVETGELKSKRGESPKAATALVHDTFVNVPPECAVVIHWPCALSPAERGALAALAARVTWFGRAESWCAMRVMDPHEPAPTPNCSPTDGSGEEHRTVVRVLAPRSGFSLADLHRDTTTLRKEGWSDPPGTRWAFYQRDEHALPPRRRAPTQGVTTDVRPTVAVFALGGPVLPIFTDGILVAEQLRRAALSRHRDPSWVLSGRDESREIVRDRESQHQHAHYLFEDRAGSQKVTHVAVFAAAGFSLAERRALAEVSYLSWHDGRTRIPMVLSGFGVPGDMHDTSPLFGRSRRWRSRTPYVLPWHRNGSLREDEAQLREEMRRRGLPSPATVRVLRGVDLHDMKAEGETITTWRSFRTWRTRRPVTTDITGFELTFEEPFAGPLLLGARAHFGIGQFVAVPE